MNEPRNDFGDEEDPIDLFIRIVDLISDHQVLLTRMSTIGDLLADLNAFSPLDYELSLYALEASTKRLIDNSFYEGDATEDLDLTVPEFINSYLLKDASDDSLFVARQFKKFARSADWNSRDNMESGDN